MSLISKIISDDNKSGSANFNLMITRQLSIRDDFNEFIRAYILNVRSISKKASIDYRPNPQVQDARLCWMLTDNIVALLENGPSKVIPAKRYDIDSDLKKGKMMIFFQDVRSTPEREDALETQKDGTTYDHWFVVIGAGSISHIIENSETECVSTMTDTTDKIVDNLMDIREGKIPDRFYHQKEKHIYMLYSLNRKSMSVKTVHDFVYPDIPKTVYVERNSKTTLKMIWSLSQKELSKELIRHDKIPTGDIKLDRVLLAQTYGEQYHVLTAEDEELVRDPEFPDNYQA